MTAALRMAERGMRVTLFEAAPDLGGKAGARLESGIREDHGYHVFFPWYRNVEQLLVELGADRDFVASDAYHQLRLGEHPDYSASWAAPSWRVLWRGPRFGSLGRADQVLLLYTVLDLLGQRYQLDDVDDSCGRFFESRWYLTAAVREELDRLVSTAVTPPADFSARTLRRAMTGYVRHTRPLCRFPAHDLHTDLVNPFRNRLDAAGVEIRTGCPVRDIKRTRSGASAVLVEGPGGRARVDVAGVVLAVPHHSVCEIGDGSLAEPGVLSPRGLHKLISRPLAALHLHMDTAVPDLPCEHVALVGSAYATSFIDISRSSPRSDGVAEPPSVIDICFVPGQLAGRSSAETARAVVDELTEYVPTIRWSAVRRYVHQAHETAPFYGNDAHSWADRPSTGTLVPNVWLAGDYVRTSIDLACMEGAVSSGAAAAEAARARLRPGSAPVAVQEVRDVPPRLAAAAAALLSPLAAVAVRAARRGRWS